jgi:N6-L-threonylcarbamoyladenine synthase
MLILGIESSCDETGVALYDTQFGLLGHRLHSQIHMHQEYGGVVPELASRDHIRRVIPLTDALLQECQRTRADITHIAFTQGPGLAGALLVGAATATGLAHALKVPILEIHHLEGHLLSPLLSEPRPRFPFVCLLVSGGHTQLMRVDGVGRYTLLGETVDDAAGEAFDKSAKLMDLGYPGGPAIAKEASSGQLGRFKLPRPMLNSSNLDFSFSGLKTAVLTTLRREQLTKDDYPDLAAELQQAIVDVLIGKSLQALRATKLNSLIVAGGVSANNALRQQLQQECSARGYEVFFPPPALCSDNGAMIAFAAAQRLTDESLSSPLKVASEGFSIRPRWPIEAIGLSVPEN